MFTLLTVDDLDHHGFWLKAVHTGEINLWQCLFRFANTFANEADKPGFYEFIKMWHEDVRNNEV